MKKGFTMIELLVVVGMLMLLMGSVTSALMNARRRAKIAKAQAYCQELTNAILALENYGAMSQIVTGEAWQELDRSSIKALLGEGAAGTTGEKIPVLFNATSFQDPWGRPYRFKVAESRFTIKDKAGSTITTSVNIPNYGRMMAGEEY